MDAITPANLFAPRDAICWPYDSGIKVSTIPAKSFPGKNHISPDPFSSASRHRLFLLWICSAEISRVYFEYSELESIPCVYRKLHYV